MKIQVNYTQKMTYRALQSKVDSMIDKDTERVVMFSMYDFGDFGGSITCPDLDSTEPVIEGKCVFMINYWRVSPEPVQSREYINPTWKDIINSCNNLLLNGDGCGVFLETMNVKEEKNGVKYIEFGIGS